MNGSGAVTGGGPAARLLVAVLVHVVDEPADVVAAEVALQRPRRVVSPSANATSGSAQHDSLVRRRSGPGRPVSRRRPCPSRRSRAGSGPSRWRRRQPRPPCCRNHHARRRLRGGADGARSGRRPGVCRRAIGSDPLLQLWKAAVAPLLPPSMQVSGGGARSPRSPARCCLGEPSPRRRARISAAVGSARTPSALASLVAMRRRGRPVAPRRRRSSPLARDDARVHAGRAPPNKGLRCMPTRRPSRRSSRSCAPAATACGSPASWIDRDSVAADQALALGEADLDQRGGSLLAERWLPRPAEPAIPQLAPPGGAPPSLGYGRRGLHLAAYRSGRARVAAFAGPAPASAC